MNLLFVVPYTPSPIRVRSYQLIKALVRRGHTITLGTTWSSDQDQSALAQLKADGIRVRSEPMPVWHSLWNCVRALPSRTPLQAVFSWQPALVRALKESILQESFDVVHVEHLRGARYGVSIKQLSASASNRNCLPVVWDSVDCISYLFDQASRQSLSRKGRWMTRLELGRTRRYEARLIGCFDRVVVTSDVDRQALEDLARSGKPSAGQGHPQINVVPNGVDLDYFKSARSPRDSATLVYTGKMSYHANVTAVVHLVRDVMPAVWERRPDVRLVIVGKDPTREVLSLDTGNHGASIESRTGAQRSVWVTGEVPDLRPFLRRATVAVVPLVYGAGIQNKVLEAMATATPVVASPKASKALRALPGRDLLVAQNSAEFAGSILALLDDPQRRDRLAFHGRQYVESHHSWDQAASKLEWIYSSLLESSPYARKSA